VLGYAAQNGTARRDDEGECEITVVDDSEEQGESVEDYGAEEASGGRTRTSARSPATDGEAGGEKQWQAVNPDCPNAANPFHRCAEYCPVPVPKVPPPPPRPRGYEGSTHSDPGELHPRPRRREKGGSGGLPLYVFRKLRMFLSLQFQVSIFARLSHLCAFVSQCVKVPMATARR